MVAICGYFGAIVLTGALVVAVDVLLAPLTTLLVMLPNAVLLEGTVGLDHDASFFWAATVG